MSDMQLIGGFNEKELMDADYAELPESGQASVGRMYDLTQYGWMRETRVKIIVQCFKKDIKSVIDAFPTNPANLTSDGGRNVDGTAATRTQWGADYVLKDITPGSKSPSILTLNALYTNEIPEAQDVYPTGLTVVCAAGVYTVAFDGTTFRTFDTDAGTCGSRGLEFFKAPQEKRRVIAHTPDDETPHATASVQNMTRTYNILKIYYDGVLAETTETLIEQVPTGAATSETYNPAQSEEVVLETTYHGIDYPSVLEWYSVSGVLCQLLWCGSPIWNFNL